jgi:hypothetical protein
MEHEGLKLDDAVAILQRTPASLRALLDGLPEIWERATEGDGTWSPYDVIGHLIHGERTDWIPRARHILAGETRAFESFDRTAQLTTSQGASMGELLATFADLRRANVATLLGLNLTDDDLARRGLHPELGTVTLGELLASWVVHDLDHIAQVVRSMAKVYEKTTGPWSAYLSILRDRQR